jgi:hypothetical protein
MKCSMMIVAALLASVGASQVHSQQLAPAPQGCYKDMSGKVSCPPLGGEIYVTVSGEAVCGKGRCVRDPFGAVTCSSQPGGQISQDLNNNQIRCAGSCEKASAATCQRLQ